MCVVVKYAYRKLSSFISLPSKAINGFISKIHFVIYKSHTGWLSKKQQLLWNFSKSEKDRVLSIFFCLKRLSNKPVAKS